MFTKINVHRFAQLVRDKLDSPEKWNNTGGYEQGKVCLTIAAWGTYTDPRLPDISSWTYYQYWRVLRKIIVERYSNKKYRTPHSDVDIIKFNDDPGITYEVLKEILDEAVRRTRPWYQKISDALNSLFLRLMDFTSPDEFAGKYLDKFSDSEWRTGSAAGVSDSVCLDGVMLGFLDVRYIEMNAGGFRVFRREYRVHIVDSESNTL